MWERNIITTNELCIGCNKCISACPLVEVNRAVVENGKSKMWWMKRAVSIVGNASRHAPI